MKREGARSAWIPLVVLSASALALRDALPSWIFMWAMATALFAGCKWLTYRDALIEGAAPAASRRMGYLLGWVGMDAKSFLGARRPQTSRIAAPEWAVAAARVFAGAVLLGLGVRSVSGVHWLLAGWVGMIGLILLLHFGLFNLLALAWRASGVDATPIMQQPTRSASVSEFWGKRWNVAFNRIVHRFVFRPSARRIGAAGATLLVFAVSGLVHELVISLPAGGGYGLPTAYFVIQGFGVLVERCALGRQLNLGRGVRGRLFAMTIVAAPAFGLFHPAFVRNVMLPMFRAIGALPEGL